MSSRLWQTLRITSCIVLCLPFLIGVAGYFFLGYLAMERMDIVVGLRYIGLGICSIGFFGGIAWSYRVLTADSNDHRLLAFSHVLLGVSLILTGYIVQSHRSSWDPVTMIPLILTFGTSRIMAHKIYARMRKSEEESDEQQ